MHKCVLAQSACRVTDLLMASSCTEQSLCSLYIGMRIITMKGLQVRNDPSFPACPNPCQCMQVQITTTKGAVIHAARVILAVGAWTNEVLRPLGLQLDLEIWAVHWGHARIDPTRRQQYPLWYNFGRERPATWDGGLYYGFPPDSHESIAKVSIEQA